MPPEIMMYIISEYEKQLQKLMSPKKYKRFVNTVAKDAFFKAISNMEDSDFKSTVLDHFDDITNLDDDDTDA